jgi:hypothetical protein
MTGDLTRWNRAGLPRLRYVDATAVTHLETLRRRLEDAFGPAWPAVADAASSDPAAQLERYLAGDPGDPAWELLRAFARAAHVVSEHVDAYTNEAYLRTATQVEHVRRIVSLIGYAPAPPASATTPLAFDVTADEVELPAGVAVRHSPDDAPAVVFETLQPLVAHAGANLLRHREARRNPALLTDASPDGVALAEDVPVVVGDPVVLEHGEQLAVRRVDGIDRDADGRAVLALAGGPPVGFMVGATTVHTAPRDRLAVRGPRDTAPVDVPADGVLRLRAAPAGLRPGDVLWASTEPSQFAMVGGLVDHGVEVRQGLERLDVDATTVGATVPLSVSAPDDEGRVALDGDWRWLGGRAVGHGWAYLFFLMSLGVAGPSRVGRPAPVWPNGVETLRVVDASYAADGGAQGQGRTTLTLDPEPGLRPPPPDPDFPWQVGFPRHHLFVAPEEAADTGVAIDAPLRAPGGAVVPAVRTAEVTHTSGGDLAVLLDGDRVAVGRVTAAVADGAGEATLAVDQWRTGDPPVFHVATTRALAHFAAASRVRDWHRNPAPLGGASTLPLPAGPAPLEPGRRVVVAHEPPPEADPPGGDGAPSPLLTRVLALTADDHGPLVVLADPLPPGMTAESVALSGNVVVASHGTVQDPTVLGSGAGDRTHQVFTLPEPDMSFVPDPVFPSGSRAAVEVVVDGRTWEQVATLQDSRADDHHYVTRLDPDGRLQVVFGDGRRGRRLPTGDGNVTARYRVGAGLVGNLDAGALDDLVRPVPKVDAVRQPMAATGGGQGDDADDIRHNAPRSVLALDRCVSLEDHAALAARRSDVWEAHARRRRGGQGVFEHVEVVVVPAGGRALGTTTAGAIRDALTAASPPSVRITVRGFVHVEVALRVTVGVDPTAFDPDEVRDAVADACRAAFSVRSRGLGRRLGRSAVLRVAEGVRGVADAHAVIDPAVEEALLAAGATDLDAVRALGADGAVRLVRARPDQVVALSVDAPAVDVVPEERPGSGA